VEACTLTVQSPEQNGHFSRLVSSCNCHGGIKAFLSGMAELPPSTTALASARKSPVGRVRLAPSSRVSPLLEAPSRRCQYAVGLDLHSP
jgi:hypothetical protein